MKQSNLFIPAFVLSFMTGILGAYLKVVHLPGGKILLIIALGLTLVYIVSALYEIYTSDKIKLSEKIMWTTGFLVITFLAAILYLVMGRPRSLRQYRLNLR